MTGMYHELSPVYGEQCTSSTVPQQASFDSEERYPTDQVYRSFAYTEAHNPSQTYSSSSPHLFGSQDELRSMRGSSVTMSTNYADNQMPQNDLPTIVNHPDLRWITTSSTNMRTQSPMNMSSPRSILPIYPTQPSTPNRNLHPQGSMEEGSASTATITHTQLPPPPSYPSSSSQTSRVLRRSSTSKKSVNPNAPTKPKGTPGRKRKFQDHELTPAEATKRHIRRERNKVAAAKCRNRRRELTDRLQGETDHLEDHQNMLHHEIISLQQEKEHLEFILAAHSPNCKAGTMLADASVLLQDEARVLRDEGMLLAPPEAIGDVNTHSDSNFYFRHEQLLGPQVPAVLATQQNDGHYDSTGGQQMRSVNLATDLSSRGQAANNCSSMAETRLTMTLDDLSTLGDAPLNTPVCTLATPSQNNETFTFPSTPTLTYASTDVSFSNNSSEFNQSASRTNITSPYAASMQVSVNRLGNPHESCSAAQRRSSSSESHQSPDSVKSPKLLAL